MELNNSNYYSEEQNKNYFSVSQFKDFLKCPACAMAKIKGEWEQEKSKRLLLGSFVDEMLTGDSESQTAFLGENKSEIIKKNGEFYADFSQAMDTVNRIIKTQPLMMKYLSGEHQTIMTGEIEGVPFKIKMDSYKPGEFIADLKYMKSLRSPNLFQNIVEYWGYDLQGAVYREIVRQNTGETLPFYLVIATKETPSHMTVCEIDDFSLNMALDKVKARIKEFAAMKSGEIPATRCEKYNCDYCTETKVVDEVINYIELGVDKEDV